MELLLVSVLLALYIAWSIGANDETMAVVAGSGITSIGNLVFLGSVMNFLGAVLASESVEKTLGASLLSFTPSTEDIFVIIAATSTWLVAASYKGWPVSTTHSIVGAALGLAASKAGLGGINTGALNKVLLGWVLSPIAGLLGSYVVILAFERLYYSYEHRGILDDLRVSRVASIILICWASYTSFFRGGNDAANSTAFLLRVHPHPIQVRILAGIGMASGLIILGRRVIKNVGTQLVVLDPASGLSVQTSMALTISIGTLMGFPISGTHVLVAALAGVGLSKRSWINIRGLSEIVLTWVMTFPGTATIAALMAAMTWMF